MSEQPRGRSHRRRAPLQPRPPPQAGRSGRCHDRSRRHAGLVRRQRAREAGADRHQRLRLPADAADARHDRTDHPAPHELLHEGGGRHRRCVRRTPHSRRAGQPRGPRGRRPDLHRHEARPVRRPLRHRPTSTPPSPSRFPVSPGPQPNAGKTIEVNAAELPRYGFQSDATPQDAYRDGLAALDTFTRKEHGVRFVELDSRATGCRARGARSRRGRRVPRRQGLLQDAARGHLRGDVRRPGIRRQSRLRRLEARRATPAHNARTRPTSCATGRSTSASRASATCRR